MKSFPWRFLLYTLFLGYLFVDLRVTDGPLKRALSAPRDTALETAREQGWVALVNQEPIRREQLDLAVARHLHLRGERAAALGEQHLLVLRRAVLNALIDETLVRQYADGEGFVADPAEGEALAAHWVAAFASPEDLESRSAAQGLVPTEWRHEWQRLASRHRWLEGRLAPGVSLTEDELRDWHETNRESGSGFVLRLEDGTELPRSYEEMAEEIRWHLENQLSNETLPVLLAKLRRVANVRLFLEHL